MNETKQQKPNMEERPVFKCDRVDSRGKPCGSTYTDELVFIRHLARVHRDVESINRLQTLRR